MKKIYAIAAIIFASLMITSTNVLAASMKSGSENVGGVQPASDTPSQDSGGSLPQTSAGSSGSFGSSSSAGLSSILSSQLINVTIKPNPAYVGQVVNFSVYVNNRSKDFTLFFAWDYGDGDSSTGNETGMGVPFWYYTNHSYSKAGDYTAKLSIRDKDGKPIYNYSSIVHVLLIFISVDAGGPYSGKVNEKILFDGSTDTARMNGITYAWDFGDGYSYSGSEPSTRHAYSIPGIYTATLSVQDENGNVFTDSTIVVVGKLSVVIHPSNPMINEEVLLGVEVLGFIPTSYNWFFGDGTTGSGQFTTHAYNESKTYYGKIVVSSYNVDIYTYFVVNVGSSAQQNTKPVPIFTVSPTEGSLSTLFEFDASDSYCTNGKIVSYEWYFGDGSILITTNPKCSYIYEKSGEWTVTCVVGNSLGEYDYITKTVEVTAEGGSRILPLAGDSIPSSKTSTAVPRDQEGLIFFAGDIKDNVEEDTGAADEGTHCDLGISVSDTPGQPDSGKLVVFHVKITDKLGACNAGYVGIKLNSDISGYDNINYYAQWNQASKRYSVDINILWPKDTKSYTVTLTAIPNSGYNEADWHGNRWSEVLSGKSTAPSDNYDNIVVVAKWGSFAL